MEKYKNTVLAKIGEYKPENEREREIISMIISRLVNLSMYDLHSLVEYQKTLLLIENETEVSERFKELIRSIRPSPSDVEEWISLD